MAFSQKQFLSTVTFLLLVVLTFTTGHKGHNKNVQKSGAPNDTQILTEGFTSNGTNSSSIDYVWDNTDDYVDHDDTDDQTVANNTVVLAEPETGLVNKTESGSPLSSAVINGTIPEQSAENSTAPVESISSSAPLAESASDEDASKSPETSSTEGNPSNDTSEVTESETEDESTVDDTIASSTQKASSYAIITEELGDVSNYTSSELPELNEIKSSGLQTWSVVIVSILISFAAILTILYFIRGELIKRRKADQRRLLRGSVSSEGYFYGDGEGNTGGKFEL